MHGIIGGHPLDQVPAQAIGHQAGQGDLVVVAVVQDAMGAAELAKQRKDEVDGVLHLAVGGQDDPAAWQPIIPHGQVQCKLAFFGLVEECRGQQERMVYHWASAKVPLSPSSRRSSKLRGS